MTSEHEHSWMIGPGPNDETAELRCTVPGCTAVKYETLKPTKAEQRIQQLEQQLAQARALLELFAKKEPIGFGSLGRYEYCSYCNGKVSSAMFTDHKADCPWVKARIFLAQHLQEATDDEHV